MDDNEEILEEEIVEEEGAKEKLKKLREDLKNCKKEKDDYLAGWQRAKADFINARRDEERRFTELGKIMEAGAILDFLAVVDSFEIFLKSTKDDGVLKIYGQFQDILKKHTVSVIECLGQNFNPEFHEALDEIETNDKEKDGIVLEELQKGYKFFDRVLRASKVKVGQYKVRD